MVDGLTEIRLQSDFSLLTCRWMNQPRWPTATWLFNWLPVYHKWLNSGEKKSPKRPSFNLSPVQPSGTPDHSRSLIFPRLCLSASCCSSCCGWIDTDTRGRYCCCTQAEEKQNWLTVFLCHIAGMGKSSPWKPDPSRSLRLNRQQTAFTKGRGTKVKVLPTRRIENLDWTQPSRTGFPPPLPYSETEGNPCRHEQWRNRCKTGWADWLKQTLNDQNGKCSTVLWCL